MNDFEPRVLEPILADNYALRPGLNYIFYRTMVYGDEKKRLQLKKSVLKTFLYRYLILIPGLIILSGSSIYAYKDRDSFYTYCVPLFLFFGIVIFIQTYVFIHFLRSLSSRESYIHLNYDRMLGYQEEETYRRDQIISRLTYELRPGPPNYHEASSVPPAYTQGRI